MDGIESVVEKVLAKQNKVTQCQTEKTDEQTHASALRNSHSPGAQFVSGRQTPPAAGSQTRSLANRPLNNNRSRPNNRQAYNNNDSGQARANYDHPQSVSGADMSGGRQSPSNTRTQSVPAAHRGLSSNRRSRGCWECGTVGCHSSLHANVPALDADTQPPQPPGPSSDSRETSAAPGQQGQLLNGQRGPWLGTRGSRQFRPASQ